MSAFNAKKGGASNGKGVVRNDRAGLKGTRGKVKKGGGGGGYTWGKPGDELLGVSTDKGDPLYDSQEEETSNIVLVSTEEANELQAVRTGIPVAAMHEYDTHSSENKREPPKVTLMAFKKQVITLTEEYLTSEDGGEFIQGLRDLDSRALHYDLVRRVVAIAMERRERERELVSLLLAKLTGEGLLSVGTAGKGFERLFEIVDDIVLDVPRARKYLAQFLARCVADEVLPPAYLSDPFIETMGGEIIEQAKVLLSIKHGLVRLERVWGPSDGSSVAVLKEEVKMLLGEFLSSSDMDEVCECVKKLNVKHFHHEIVKRSIVIAMEKKQRERAMMCSLLAELFNREIVSLEQMHLGFERLLLALPDLELDTPGATKILDIFIAQAIKDGCVLPDVIEQLRKKAAETAEKNGGVKIVGTAEGNVE